MQKLISQLDHLRRCSRLLEVEEPVKLQAHAHHVFLGRIRDTLHGGHHSIEVEEHVQTITTTMISCNMIRRSSGEEATIPSDLASLDLVIVPLRTDLDDGIV